VLLAPAAISDAGYRQALAVAYGAQAGAAVYAQYPPSAFESPRDALVAATTDAAYVCPARRLARAATAGGQAAVFRYFFTRALRGAGALGAFHGEELGFLFGNLASFSGYRPSDSEQSLSRAMQRYWINMAASGDPNDELLPEWTVYDPVSDSYLQLDIPIEETGMGVHTANCDFWDSPSD
jgi:para-nitrobenzyl esterase